MPLRSVTKGFGSGFPSVLTLGYGGEIVSIGTAVEVLRRQSIFDVQYSSDSKTDSNFSKFSEFDIVFSAQSKINLEIFED